MSADPTTTAMAVDAPEASASTPRSRGGRFRKRGGRGSKQKRIDDHRLEQNVKTDDERRAKIAERFGVPHTSIELPPELSRRIKARGQVIAQPTMRVPIVTGCITSVLDECFAFLRSSKIEVTDLDVTAVTYVTSVQISAKIYMSSIRNHVALSHIDIYWSSVFNSTAMTCTDNLLPVARFIDAIGSFRHDGSVFTPVVAYTGESHPHRGIYDLTGPDYGRVLTHLATSQASYDVLLAFSVLSEESYQEIWQYLHPYADQIPLKIAIPSYSDGKYIKPEFEHVTLVERYKKFMNTLARRFPRAVVNMDIQSGQGSHIQVVGSRKRDFDAVDVWSSIKMDSGDMTLGGLYGYGRDIVGIEPSAFHAEDACPYKMKVYDTGWVQDMARSMHPT